jgi:uncharacterized membrane protein
MAEIKVTENKVLMQQARDALKGKWGLAAGTYFVFILISVGLECIRFPKVGGVLSFIMTGPLNVGLAVFFLAISRNKEPQFSHLFDGFKNFLVNSLTLIYLTIFIILWSLLLIIPGIIAAISYSMTFFIRADDDSLTALEAITKSKKMMYGYKWKLFCLYLRFIGWALLCILTLGIGFLWLVPYIEVSAAKFYDDLLSKTIPQVTTTQEK